MSSLHTCPGPGCDELIPRNMLACRRHWGQVPGHLKRAVYAAWDHGAGYGTPEHADAMKAAIARMAPVEVPP